MPKVKVTPNLAVCPEAWLMASRMIINMDSVTGYNKELKQAVVGMKVGVNNSANSDIKSRSCADGWSYVEDQKTDLASLESY